MNTNLSQQTLPQKAADAIIRLIQTENYAAGTKLPNEYELSRMLNVSRNTVREAIKLLVSRNVLNVRRGAGTFVSDKHGLGEDPLGLSMITDQSLIIQDMIQTLFMIEPRSTALAARNASAEDIGQLYKIVSELEDPLQKQENILHSDIAFHLQIARCSHNTVIYNICQALYSHFIRQYMKYTDYSDPMVSHILSDHYKICQAIEAHDSYEAYACMTAHLLHDREFLQTHLSDHFLHHEMDF